MVDPVALAVSLVLSKHFEGFQALPYLCPAGIPTIGFGFTHYADGSQVTLSDPAMTREEAEVLLEYLLRTMYIPQTIRLCPNVDTPERLGALADFCFNVGRGNLAASTLRRYVNSGFWDRVPSQLRRWNRGGGKVLRGLTLRREAEIAYI
jgi:lysozyme